MNSSGEQRLLRQQRVAKLATRPVPEIQRQLVAEGIVNPQTGKPYALTTVRTDLALAEPRQPVSEMIGRVDYTYPFYRSRPSRLLSVDRTMTDYVAWDRLRRGKLHGFEMSGLYCQPIVQIITAFELGGGFSLALEDDPDMDAEDEPAVTTLPVGELVDTSSSDDDGRAFTDRVLDRFSKRFLSTLQRTSEDNKALGDQYTVVNPDGSFSTPSPDTVKIDTDPLDYRKVIKVTVRTVLDRATITDEYTDELRVVRVRWTGTPEVAEEVATFPNLIGRIPVIHWANDRSGNELFGRPIYEPLFRTFSRMDDLLEKMLDGVELMGNPIPVFSGVEDVKAFLKANGVLENENYYDADGNMTTRTVLAMDKLPAVILGKGADAKMLAPNRGMTEDIAAALQELFTLICVFTRIPVPLWGNYQRQGKSAQDPELPPFLQYILTRRQAWLGEGVDDLLEAQATDGLYGLVDIWLRTMRLTNPKIVVGAVKATFPELTPEDATVLLQKVIWADGTGKLRASTALEKLRLVSDPAKEVKLAQAEAIANQPVDFQTAINTAAHAEQDPSRATPTPKAANITTGKPPLPAGGRRPALDNGKPVGELDATAGSTGALTLTDNALPVGVDPVAASQTGKRRRRRKKTLVQGAA